MLLSKQETLADDNLGKCGEMQVERSGESVRIKMIKKSRYHEMAMACYFME